MTGCWPSADLTYVKKLVPWCISVKPGVVTKDRICVTGDVAQRGDKRAAYDIPSRASHDVHTKFVNLQFFNARWVLIVTWHNVTFYGAASTPRPVYR